MGQLFWMKICFFLTKIHLWTSWGRFGFDSGWFLFEFLLILVRFLVDFHKVPTWFLLLSGSISGWILTFCGILSQGEKSETHARKTRRNLMHDESLQRSNTGSSNQRRHATWPRNRCTARIMKQNYQPRFEDMAPKHNYQLSLTMSALWRQEKTYD